jgi:hypothetical protein
VRRFVPLLIVTLASPIARADKQACLTAHEDAQRLRSEGKLRAARDKLLICAAEACPSLVKVDCTKWLPEVDRDVPTLIVRAKDAAGLDVTDASAELDGAAVSLGKALAIDPGTHSLKVERGGKTIEQQVVVAAGEKNRIVEVAFPNEPVSPPAESASPLPWILAGVGVVGIAGFAAFGLSARGRLSELRDTCAPNCDPGEKRSIQTQLVLADVSLAIGVVSLGVATYLFLKPTKTTTVALSPGYASFSVVF